VHDLALSIIWTVTGTSASAPERYRWQCDPSTRVGVDDGRCWACLT